MVVQFGGVTALDRCSLTLQGGLVTGLIGPNGAGKTTLLNAIAGLLRPQEGRISFAGEAIGGLPPHRLAERGLVRTFQIARELGSLTVLENLLLAAPAQRGERMVDALLFAGAVRRQERQAAEQARDILERIGLWRLADAPAGSLSGGQKKLLELGRAMMLRPRFILLDEPAAGVAPPMVAQIADLVGSLRSDGLSFAVVEHDMELVERLCDRVYVLAEGRCLVSGTFAEVKSDPRVVEAYLGQPA